MNAKTRSRLSLKHKILLIVLGLFLSLIILELGMRISARAVFWAQSRKNMIAAQKRGTCRILCLGESTTALGGADSYPAQLERILNQRSAGKKFAVLNAGIVAGRTQEIVSRLEKDIDKYRPDIVVAMMGINDGYDHNVPYINKRDFRQKASDFITSLRIVKLGRFINMSIRQRGVKINTRVKFEGAGRAYAEQALLYRHQGKFSEAAKLFRKALALDPRDDMACLELGCTYIFQGDYPAAQDILEKGMELSPGNDSMYYWFGVLCMKRGKPQQAKEYFSRSARINPLNDRAYGGLGTLYASLNKKEDSQRGYNMAERVREEYYNPSTRGNFLLMKKITGNRGVKLVCAQYPMRGIGSLRRIFSGDDRDIVFVDNERIFKEAVNKDGYQAYFEDMFAGDFGHCAARGNRLLAENIADAILTQAADGRSSEGPRNNKKLYWFIPDGMRAEPYLFDIYAWARNGDLPNIKRIMDNGTYGFCKPVYPGHTPVNFAAILTGTYPETNGVADGPMHTNGHSLVSPSMTGFSSTARKVEAIWSTLENRGRSVMVLSVPGSTPPELERGDTIVGRWGGWGANFYAVNFETILDASVQYHRGRESRLFYFGPALAIFPEALPAQGWALAPRSYSQAKEAALEAWGAKIYAYIYDSTNDSKINYDRVAFSADKKMMISDLKQGQWSGWLPIELSWDGMPVDTTVRIKVITLAEDGLFKVRFFYNNLNNTLTKPVFLTEDIIKNVGPMVDYADSFPAQLIYSREDKDTFTEESGQSFDWHRRAADYLLKTYKPDVFIQDIYTPNQMLTSRWWLGYVDPDSLLYHEKTDAERAELWKEVKNMYKDLDGIIGEYLKNADENTVIVVSSDHGAVPLHTWVRLNNLFARKGWLFFKLDPITGNPEIDWRRSTVVYLNYGHVFIDPAGLHNRNGTWRRSSGPRYNKLREEVVSEIKGLKDANGVCPLTRIVAQEDAGRVFHLPDERVGDLILANRPGYAWNEEMSDDKELFSKTLITGYKQGIVTEECPAIWCPFMVMGPGVKKNNFLGNEPINMIDQYPTLMKLLGFKSPDFVQGKPLDKVSE